MALIKSVRIKNFRSIVDATIHLDDYNCFVGKNDSGKSNVLKALNLFFNGKTDFDTEFDFDADYSQLAAPKGHRAKEIIISIDVDIPKSFKESGIKTWTKVWRADGLQSDNIDSLFTGMTKAKTLLSRLTYKYIPAVKSNEYFKNLLSDVYVSMTKSANSALRTLNDRYSVRLRSLTVDLTEDLKNVLNMDSALQMPQDLNILFRDLSFSTADKYVEGIDLNHRGDGVKARHIPSILRYMQNNAEKYREKNAIVSTFVWGYEEPENGVEFLACFEMANDLFSYSSDTQMLISTHSPSFYSLAKEPFERNNCYYVYKADNGASKYDLEIDEHIINEKIGLMPIVTPYIERERERLRDEKVALENLVNSYRQKYEESTGRIVIIPEGKTDVQHIRNAFMSMDLEQSLLSRMEYYDFSNNETLGSKLEALLKELKNIPKTSIIIGIYDRDKAIRSCADKPYEYLGNNVFVTNIPALDNIERKLTDRISIEHYYTNAEITKVIDDAGKRLYLGKDFNRFGLSIDGNWCYQGMEHNNSISPITIIDKGNKHLQRISENASIATKSEFADYVVTHSSEFNLENFKKIFGLIRSIVIDSESTES